MKHRLVIVLLFINISLSAQNEGNIWYFGDSAGVSFNGPQPVILTDGTLFAPEASSVICDKNGELLFYCGGFMPLSYPYLPVKNKFHNIVSGSQDIYGDYSCTQGALFIPHPLYENLIYMFRLINGYFKTNLYVSVIDKTGNNNGSIFEKNRLLTPVDSCLTEKMIAIRHANGRDWWLLLHEIDTNLFVKFLITSDTILGPYKQAIGSKYGGAFDFGSIGGQMTSSKQGDKIACVNMEGIIDVLNFDRCSGELSGWIDLSDNVSYYYGCAFSPDANKLYVAISAENIQVSKLFQFDLIAPDILLSKLELYRFNNTNNTFGQMLLAPDHKIFCAQTWLPISGGIFDSINMYLGVIENPNLPGFQCNFVQKGFYLNGRISFWSLPNIPNYSLGALEGSPCDTIPEPLPPEPETQPVVYIPNIFSPNADGHNDVFYVRGQNITGLHLQIYNRWGGQVFESTEPSHGWDGNCNGKKCADGVYYYVAEITFGNGETVSRKGSVTLVR